VLVLEDGTSLALEDWQRAFVVDLFAGRSLNWLIVPEGNGKTTLLASLGLYGLRFAEHALIPIAASSRDQARIMYRQMKGFVQRSRLGEHRDGLWFEAFDGYRRIDLRSEEDRNRRGDTVGTIELHAADAGTADGVIPYPYCFLDELHRHADLALYRTWAGKLRKRGAQLIAISTGGEPGSEFEIARERIKERAVGVELDGAFGRFTMDRLVMHEYMVRDLELVLNVAAVKAANPLEAITAEYLAGKLDDPTMTERHWRRFTCNIATMDEGVDPFISESDWDTAAGPAWVVEDGSVVCLGADGSRTWDTTVIAWAHQDDTGVVTVDASVFSVRDDIPCHVKHLGGKIDFDDVEAFLIDRFDRFTVIRAAYDPRYLERTMELADARLPDAALVAVEPSSKPMRDALQTMFNLAAEGKLRHRGDPVLRQHVLNAGCERGLASELRRVRKIDGRLPIDAVPAMALACWQATVVTPVAEPFALAF
jgi:phage terminase large subunit-like protein